MNIEFYHPFVNEWLPLLPSGDVKFKKYRAVQIGPNEYCCSFEFEYTPYDWPTYRERLQNGDCDA